MFKIMSAEEAVSCIKDGDTIALNSFLTLCNPELLHSALYTRFKNEGSPKNLTLFCPAGFGGWNENDFAEPYVKAGAVKRIISSHFGSMPASMQMIADNDIEGYCLPLGVLAKTVRAAASGNDGILSPVGLNIFVDPDINGPAMNSRSDLKLVEKVNIGGKDMLYYKAPKIDVAFIKATSIDPRGNVTFKHEYARLDAFSMAQAARQNGGIVIVQVEKLSHDYGRPGAVRIPGALVDIVVVNPDQQQIPGYGYNPSLSGDIHVPVAHMDYWMGILKGAGRGNKNNNLAQSLIGARASKEISEGDIINIGVGIPEYVSAAASAAGILDKVTLTVESGAVGGLPAPGLAFGSSIGADMITDMAALFDFYDGGGLDVCFAGNYQVDLAGNVNTHKLNGLNHGIGGLANMTNATKKIVFCGTFMNQGLEVSYEDGHLSILKDGRNRKFVERLQDISFSAQNALAKKQEVVYITERCVFRLEKDGIILTEIADGISLSKDILNYLPEGVKVADKLKPMDFSNLYF